MKKVWFKSYPKGVAHTIDSNRYQSIGDLFYESCQKFRDRPAFDNFGSSMTFEDLFFMSNDFAAFLQKSGLKKGDRVAIQLPNILQYPVVMFAVLRAGLVVVNTNPLYTPKEMKHQFCDSGAKALIIYEGSAAHLQEILHETDIKTVVVTGVGDLLGWPKSWIYNGMLKYVKKMVPSYDLPGALTFYEALDIGAEHGFTPPEVGHEDLAFLQYTGGTTGVSKGAMLSHGNMISNMLQIVAWMKPLLREGEEITVGALPMYHIFSMTLNCLAFVYFGGTNVLVTNPRDIPGFIKVLKQYKFTAFPGLNTLFNALMNHPEFLSIDFSSLKIAVAGGMALQNSVALRWQELTHSQIVEGYGLTETSPVTNCNPIDGTARVGTIGPPLPSTDIKLVDDQDNEVTELKTSGEICVKGPQVMKGYWKKPEETAKVMMSGGWLRTGDIGQIDADGFFKIVDRKKDMILVSGFNVFPNEIEDVVASNPKVLEVAAIGVPDDKSGEVVKIFIVKRDATLTEDEIKAYCREQLTHYKLPKYVEFRTELPKSNVGKILRRELREPVKAV